MELEPLYQHALRLLHSRRDDAKEKLKKKLFEIMGRRYEAPKEIYKSEPAASSMTTDVPAMTMDNAESLDEKSGLSKHVTRGLPEAENEARSRSSGTEEVVVEDTGSAEKALAMETGITDIDADDFAIDMGIACIVCRLFEVSSNNQLVECQECHSLYHQLCHKPSVTEQEVNDPRSVWYCARCSKSMKKLEKNSIKSAKPQTSTKESSYSSKAENSGGKQEASFFRRLDSGKSSVKDGNSNVSSKPYSGLAVLAANLSGKSSEKSLAHKDDKGNKEAKKPSADALDRTSKPKVLPGESAHDKSKKAKPGADKSMRHESKETDTTSGRDRGGVKSGSAATNSKSSAFSLSHDGGRASVIERVGAEERRSSKLSKGSTDKVAKGGGQLQTATTEKVQRGDKESPQKQATSKDEDSLHKHKAKKFKKE